MPRKPSVEQRLDGIRRCCRQAERAIQVAMDQYRLMMDEMFTDHCATQVVEVSPMECWDRAPIVFGDTCDPAQTGSVRQASSSQEMICTACGKRHDDGELYLDNQLVCGLCFNCETKTWRDKPPLL